MGEGSNVLPYYHIKKGVKDEVENTLIACTTSNKLLLLHKLIKEIQYDKC